MQRRLIYDNWFFRSVLRGVSFLFLKIAGWRVVGETPPFKKCVIVAGPHTSNWDFPMFMAVAGFLKLRVGFLGKHSLFEGSLGWLFYYLGGIPVDRSDRSAADIVGQVVRAFHERDQLILGIAPEGTRTKVKKWKTGFYRIAEKAGVPIVCAYVDSASKTVGFGAIFHPSGDIDADMLKIQAFYADKRGINPNNQ